MLVLVAALVSCWAARAEDVDPRSCALVRGPSATVTSVVDGDTVLLADGSTVRLAGVLAPRPSDVAEPGVLWPAAEASREHLAALVSGRTVLLGFAGRRSDRWGTLVAHVFVARMVDGVAHPALWVQGRLLSDGHARAHTQPGMTACARELALHEEVGRGIRRGLWADPHYAVLRADQTRALSAAAGTYVLAEGRVVQVAESRGGTAVRFGADPRRDFAVLLTPVVRRAFVAAGIDLKALAGRLVRVRGWVAVRGGPFIDLHHPQQIEIADVPAPMNPGEARALPVPRFLTVAEDDTGSSQGAGRPSQALP